MARSASSWPAIAETDRLVIHMLGARNRSLAEIMSGDNASRFVGEHWHEGGHGLPILDNVTTWMVGRVIERFPVHNSVVVVVQIESGEVGADDAPLLYHERQYLRPGEVA
jgi:flavin reductase (DIM6/NTAB) family NADH-FMN oxidoreductase RutF